MATTQKSLAATSSTYMRTISVVGPWASPYPRAPYGGKKTASSWPKPLQITQQTIPEGFLLEVDLKYTEHLHNALNAYPLAPERMVVQKKWMSEYQHNLRGVGVGRQRL